MSRGQNLWTALVMGAFWTVVAVPLVGWARAGAFGFGCAIGYYVCARAGAKQ